MKTFPSFLQDLLEAPPRAGEGIHAWLFRVARQLHAHLPAMEIFSLLKSKVSNCGRHVPDSEIMSAVKNAVGCAWRPGDGGTATPPPTRAWPECNDNARAIIVKDGPGLADIWEASPRRIEDNDAHTEAFIDQLFPGNPLLCCGQTNSVFETKSREEWRGQLASMQLIVPSPMTELTGLTKAGKQSAHALSNTGPRRFLVIEFDRGTFDDHAALLNHLAGYGPLVLAVHSGKKSLHGWFFCVGQSDDTLRRFMRYAVSLGADPATWTPSQFVRMADGTRDNGKRQTVFYFDPRPLEGEA